MGHRAGLSALTRAVTTDDLLSWSRMVALLEEQSPLWTPGTAWSYHALTHGWLVGEILRRITDLSVGELLQRSVAAPLAVDFHVGLPSSLIGRVSCLGITDARVEQSRAQEAGWNKLGPNWDRLALTLGGALPPELAGPDKAGFNDPRLWHAEIPGAGGIGTARALAKIWSATVVRPKG